jgi:SHS2 domain-containing protein
MGFKEKNHTADWALLVWGKDIASLFTEAARGMYALMSPCMEASPRQIRMFSVQGTDDESRLVAFLNELIFYLEQEKLVFDAFDLEPSLDGFEVSMQGSGFTSIEKMIKAVTFHNLEIIETLQGYQVEIVFDV